MVMVENDLLYGSTSDFAIYQLESGVACFETLLRSKTVRRFSTSLEGIAHNGDLLSGCQVGLHFGRVLAAVLLLPLLVTKERMTIVSGKRVPFRKAPLEKIISLPHFPR